MKKGECVDNSFGIACVVLGIVGIVMAIAQPIMGIALCITAFVFSLKQKKIENNKWAKAGMVLAIVGVIAGILMIIVGIIAIKYLADNPELIAQLQGLQGAK